MIFMEYGKSRAPRFNASSGTSVASSAVADASSGIASATSSVVASSVVASSGTASVVASSAVVASSVVASFAHHPRLGQGRVRVIRVREFGRPYLVLYTNATKKLY